MVYDEAHSRVLLMGGIGPATAGASDADQASLWAWNGATWTYMSGASGPAARNHFAAAFDAGRGRLVIMGGRQGDSPLAPAMADTWEWDGTAWSRAASSTSARSHAASAYDRGRARVVMAGGIDGNGSTLFQQLEWLGSSWSALPVGLPGAAFAPALVSDGSPQLLLLESRESDRQLLTYRSAGNGAWASVSTAGPALTGYAVAPAPGGGVILFGGSDGTRHVGVRRHALESRRILTARRAELLAHSSSRIASCGVPTPVPLQHSAADAERLTVAIVDDEPLARNGLRALVRAMSEFLVVGDAGNGGDAVALIRRVEPDIVLLDVQMPGMDGFGVLSSLGALARPAVVFVTAFDTYALRAFDVHAVDYVLKPYTAARVREALLVARSAHGSRLHAKRAERLDAMLRAIEAERTTGGAAAAAAITTISVRGRSRIDLVPIGELVWIEADGSYVRLHGPRGALLHRESLDSLERRLDPAHFIRIHRSALVATRCVRQVLRSAAGRRDVVLSTGQRVPASRAGWHLLREALTAPTGSRA